MEKRESAGPEEFRKDLSAGRVPQIVALTGEETRLKEQALQDLLIHLLGDQAGEFNLAQFDGAAADQEAFFASAFAPPLFSGRRVAVVRRCEEAPWLEILPRYLPDLPASTTLILVSGAETGGPAGGRPRKSALEKTLQAAGDAGRRYDFAPLKRCEALSYLQAEARRLGLTLTPEAADALQAKLGTDLAALVAELEKLAVYLGPAGGRADLADVEAVVGRTALDSSFVLVDAILAGNVSKALAALQDLFTAGETPQALLAQLAAQFRRVVQVKASGAENWPGVKLLRPLELGSAWAAEKVRDQARAMPLDRAERALALLLRADYRLKHRRGLVPEVELEVLAAELCRESGRAPSSVARS